LENNDEMGNYYILKKDSVICGWLVGWLVVWLVGWLIGWLVG
jgi:hypothetical protein